MHDTFIENLEQKDALHQLEWDLKNKFDFSDILSEALMNRINQFLEENNPRDLGVGQIPYWGVVSNEPSGKPMAEMEKSRVTLTLYHPDDIVVLRVQGIRALRQCKVMRLTVESKDQGVLLTQEDLALLLCSTVRTIRNDVRELRDQGVLVPTRGQMKDIGKGVSHKARIVGEYLRGYEYSEIERRTNHSAGSIDRYIRDFSRVVYLTQRGEDLHKIRQVTRLSERLIQEYQALYTEFSGQECQRLEELTHAQAPAKKGGAI